MPLLLVLAALVASGAAVPNPGTPGHSWTWPKYTGRPAATGIPNDHWPNPSGSWNGRDWPCPSEVASQWAKVTPTPTVSLASGAVVGTTTSVPSATVSVNQFLGIPFADSPPLRFAPPEDAKPWTTPLNATKLPPSCLQQFNYPEIMRDFVMAIFNNPAPASESEDCLYLNVYAPASPFPIEGRAVMFWIYGGDLQFGYSGVPFYDGSSFAANQDVIVVTTNYRTNIFGFSNSPEIPVGEQNSGFLDQRKALDWVQNNIANFGGDPKKVTIFGESAGGYSVKQLWAHPPSPPAFRAAIMESEAASFTGSGAANWETLVAAVNCSSAASHIACVRAVNGSLIEDIISRQALDFAPVPDNITSTNDISHQLNGKTAAHIPILIGTNAGEGRVFAFGQTNATAYVDTTFPAALQQEVLGAYPATESGYFTISDIITQVGFQCPAQSIADLATKDGYDVWRYYFNASFPNFQPFGPDSGVFHSSEIPEVFGTYLTANATAQQIALSKYMQTAWADFAKEPAAGPGWSKVGNGTNDVADIGGNGSDAAYVIDPATIDKNCAIYDPLFTYFLGL